LVAGSRGWLARIKLPDAVDRWRADTEMLALTRIALSGLCAKTSRGIVPDAPHLCKESGAFDQKAERGAVVPRRVYSENDLGGLTKA